MSVTNGIQDTDNSEELWHLYKSSGGTYNRNNLIDFYLDKTKALSGKLYASRLSNIADYNDYLHYGLLGLMSSIDKYDPMYGAQFFTYASYRIKGSIIDGISSMEEKTASTSTELIFKHRFYSISEQQEDEDLFDSLIDTSVMLAIGFMLENNDEINDQYSTHAFQELKDGLKEYVGLLDNDEKMIIEYHYFHQVSFITIAEILGLSKSRISQIHRKALLFLREKCSKTLELKL